MQQVLAGKARPKRQTHAFLYRGYLSCNLCQCAYTASLKKQRYTYYYCTNGKGVCGEHRHYLDTTQVTDLLKTLFVDFSLPEDLAKVSLELYEDRLRKAAKSQDYASQSLTKDLERLEGQLTRLEDMLLDERISPERYDLKRKALLKQETETKIQLKQLPPLNVETTLELAHQFKDQAVNLGDMFAKGDDEVRSELLKAALWNCEISDGKIVSTRYKKPFAFFEGLSKSSDLNMWRRWWDSNPRDPNGSRFSKPLPLATRRHLRAP